VKSGHHSCAYHTGFTNKGCIISHSRSTTSLFVFPRFPLHVIYSCVYMLYVILCFIPLDPLCLFCFFSSSLSCACDFSDCAWTCAVVGGGLCGVEESNCYVTFSFVCVCVESRVISSCHAFFNLVVCVCLVLVSLTFELDLRVSFGRTCGMFQHFCSFFPPLVSHFDTRIDCFLQQTLSTQSIQP